MNLSIIALIQDTPKSSLNLKNTHNPSHHVEQTNHVDKHNWVVNLSEIPLQHAERSLFGKRAKFAPTPSKITYKNIVVEVEAAITVTFLKIPQTFQIYN